MAKGMKNKMTGNSGVKATTSIVAASVVEEMLHGWENVAQKAARKIIEKYGLPNEAAPSRLLWYRDGPWKRTIVNCDEIPHNFPAPHADVPEQVIVSDLAAFDGSVILERTKGEVAARCDLEAANFLSLNLMHDVASGSLTVEQAREKYVESISADLMNRAAPYSEGVLFDPPVENTQDVDETIIGSAMLEQFPEKMKDAFR
jgi:hypothetical protein